jgi:lactonase
MASANMNPDPWMARSARETGDRTTGDNMRAGTPLDSTSRRQLLRTVLGVSGLGALGALAVSATASAADAMAKRLAYTPDIQEPVPIPQSERGLLTVRAEPYFKVSDKGLQLEAASFDRQGNLLFVDVFGGTIFKLTPKKTLSTVLPANALGPAGIGIHKDGRIFVAGLGNFVNTGSIFWINPDGTGLTTIVPASDGYLADDLVFDANGGFYFTDFRGSSTELSGGVYYVSPDFKTVTPILKNLAIANGVCLSPDGKVLWATELSAGRLHRVELANPTTIAPFGTMVPYYFNGFAPDSMRSDADGNVYVAMYSQGRILAFNSNGIAIGQILLPMRETGHNMRSTSMGFFPGTDDMVILTNDGNGGQGSWIFQAKGFAKGTVLYSHS